MKLSEEIKTKKKLLKNMGFQKNHPFMKFFQNLLLKTRRLERENKNITENLVRAKQILSELREQLDYEQKQNEKLKTDIVNLSAECMRVEELKNDYKKLQQEKKELRIVLSELIYLKYNNFGLILKKDYEKIEKKLIEKIKQLLSKIKE